jgi:hypothetical protein
VSALDALPPIAEAAPADADALDAAMAAGTPLVLRGVAGHWPALAAARRSPAALGAYLRAMDRGGAVPVMEAPASTGGRFGYGPDLREFSFTKRQRPLAETLDRIEAAAAQPGGPVIAIQLLPLAERLPAFVADNPMPLVPDGAAPKLWLGGPVRTQIHNDRDHNLAVVVAGARRFVLFPPDAVGDLYIGPLDNPPALSLVDPEAPDLARFPRFAAALARARVAELAPGDAIAMPRHWWHHVTSRAPYNAMVNYWWGAARQGLDDPFDAFLTALVAIKGLPEAERGYWRAVFDTHVFGDADAAAAHLPPALRGVLGTMSRRDRDALKRQLSSRVLASP